MAYRNYFGEIHPEKLSVAQLTRLPEELNKRHKEARKKIFVDLVAVIKNMDSNDRESISEAIKEYEIRIEKIDNDYYEIISLSTEVLAAYSPASTAETAYFAESVSMDEIIEFIESNKETSKERIEWLKEQFNRANLIVSVVRLSIALIISVPVIMLANNYLRTPSEFLSFTIVYTFFFGLYLIFEFYESFFSNRFQNEE